MSILKIRKFNDPVLRKRAKRVWKIDEEIHRLILNMEETIKEKQGVGLAAPQIGVLKKAIVVETDPRTQKTIALINPKIVKKSKEKSSYTEGCLSFPDIFLEIRRPRQVTVKGQDMNGRKIEIKADGLLARVLQHEIDHLNGIVFLDRLRLLERIKFKLKNFNIKL
ncbi:MAG: peptide deformylase [bacterium]|nr:peptide deformylase [bacterium]